MSGSPKIFFAKLRDMTERFDARYHSPAFAENLDRIKRGPWRALGECCKISTETWDREKLFPERFPYIEIAAINTDVGEITATEELSTAEAPSRAQMVVRSGDILVSMTRPTRNAIARVPDTIGLAIASTGFAVLRSINEDLILPDYFFHALRFGFCSMQFDQRSSGGNYPAITKDDLKKMIIPVPQPDVQKRIVAELDAAYAAKKKAEEKAARMLASIDDVIFSELGMPPLPPQDNSLRARMFLVSSQEIIGNRLDAYRYHPFFALNEKRIRSLPSSRLGELVTLSHETWAQGKWNDTAEGTFPYIEIGAISTETGTVTAVEDIAIADAPSRARMIVREGDLLISLTRPTRRALAFVPSGYETLVASTGFAVIRQHNPAIDRQYLFEILRSKLCVLQFDQRSSGGNYPAITEEQLLQCLIPVPERQVQRRIVQKATSLRLEAKRLQATAAEALASTKSRLESHLT